MRYSKFQSECSELAALLPPDFMRTAGTENPLREAISEDRVLYLDKINQFVSATPAETIVQDPRRLTSKLGFQSFLAEMRAFVALQNWVVCPTPADTLGATGGPDFEHNLGAFDVEVASRPDGDPGLNIVSVLNEKFAGSAYEATIHLREGFASTQVTQDHTGKNQQILSDIIETLESIDPNDPPDAIETTGIKLEFSNSSTLGKVSMWDEAPDTILDEYGRISDQLHAHVTRQRGARPLLLFYDVADPNVDIELLRRILHGKQFSGKNVQVSEKVFEHKPMWGEYLREQQYIPESGKTTWIEVMRDPETEELTVNGDTCIRDGDEGLFANPEFESIVGVLFVDAANEGHFLPNFYSTEMNFYPFYRTISNNMHTTNLFDLL